METVKQNKGKNNDYERRQFITYSEPNYWQ